MNTTEMKDYEIAAQEAQELFNALNINAQISSPVGDVKDEWPCIFYNVTLSRAGQNLTTEYRLGVGHVQWPKRYEDIPNGTRPDLIPVFNTLRMNPHAKLKSQLEQAQAAAWLATVQKVAPKAFEVLSAICADASSAHNSSWDNYAAEFGTDVDSIKGKAVYDYCGQLYHKVVALIGADNVARFAELHSCF